MIELAARHFLKTSTFLFQLNGGFWHTYVIDAKINHVASLIRDTSEIPLKFFELIDLQIPNLCFL
jgi:hypothetical protein